MGDRLEAILIDRGWTQAELGRRLRAIGYDWSRQHISIKFSKETWGADTIWAIAQALKVSTDTFFSPTITLPGKTVGAPKP
ncbi:MAG: hypothetical protein LZF86_140017 [Nitrospira sp.]|nr:MAG: hypothetical protein LZF86_140017 [Nitrospira sp.]